MLGSYLDLPFFDKSIALQGGEPLLAPDFVFDALGSAPVRRSVQTNATLVTPERARRFRRGDWLVGASLDGPREFHDANRLDSAGRGSFDAAVAGIRELERAEVDFNLLTVVSTTNVGHAREIYRYLRDNFKTIYQQYIECTGPAREITGEEWGEFLVELFDEWAKADTRRISIRLFDSLVSELVEGHPTQCSCDSHCRQYLVVEMDGSVYPCDFHVREDLKLGNILTDSWEEMLASPVYERFAAAKTASLPRECRECEFLRFCEGDCPRNRREGRSVLCAGWKRFFAFAIPRLETIVGSLQP